MVTSSISRALAVVAALMRKLCPAYSLLSTLAEAFTKAINLVLINAFLFSNLNRSPGTLPHLAKCAAIGQSLLYVQLTTLFLYGSIFDSLRCTFIIVGLLGLSIAMSL